MLYGPGMRARLAARTELAQAAGLPLLATNDVLMHAPERRPLADVLQCIRLGTTLDQAGRRLAANAERHLKVRSRDGPHLRRSAGSRGRDPALSRRHPVLVAAAANTITRTNCAPVSTPNRRRSRLMPGPARDGAIQKACRTMFVASSTTSCGSSKNSTTRPISLTVHDVVRFARDKDILCQGRGSAANSVLCYCLGITEIDPVHHSSCCSSASSPRTATSRPTSMSTSSTSGAKR